MCARDAEAIVFLNRDRLAAHPVSITRLFVLVLNEILQRFGVLMVHGACLSRNGKGLCLIGASGSGKTTLLLNLVSSRNFRYISDDLLLMRQGNGGVDIYSFSDMVNVSCTSQALFKGLAPATSDSPGRGKEYMRLRAWYPGSYQVHCRPACNAFVETGPQTAPSYRVLQKHEAFARLINQTALSPGRTPPCRKLRTALALVNSCKNVELRLNYDLEQSSRLCEELWASL